MRCEVVAVGTELLLGQVVDTNSAWIGEQLARSGIDCTFQVKVGDNVGRIAEALRAALARSDAVVVCGGLGPTHDDLTRDAIAAVLGVPLVPSPELAERIEAMFVARGRAMPANNLRQAEVPEGATAIRDPQPGTAPGLVCPVPGTDKVIYAVPGVPAEMEAIVAGAVLADLRRRDSTPGVIVSRTLRTWGEGESAIAERLAERIRSLDTAGTAGMPGTAGTAGPATIALLANFVYGVQVRITVKAPDALAAAAVLDLEEARARAVLGDLVFGTDSETVEQVVGAHLQAQGLSLGVAESLTGGLLGARLSSVAGASAYFRGSIVAYDAAVKHDLLAVPAGPVVGPGAAEAMAEGAARALGSDVGLAVTGVAGPAEQEGQPVGTVFVGLALDGEAFATRLRLPGGRDRVRDLAVVNALHLLRRRLRDRAER
ncbi:MAG: competence/damage-inducible protein A [Acidimicrobiia bacterium]